MRALYEKNDTVFHKPIQFQAYKFNKNKEK